MTTQKTSAQEPPSVYPEGTTPSKENLDFEQLITGVRQSFRELERAYAAYKMLNGAMKGELELPTQEMPLGMVDADGQPIRFCLNLNEYYREFDIRDPEDQKKLREALLLPWNNMAAVHYTRALRNLREFSEAAHNVIKSR